jgi:hypothetical protein
VNVNSIGSGGGVFRKIIITCGVLIVACGLAIGSAWVLVLHGPSAGGIATGPWRMSAVAGSVDAGMYARARIAITGLFALNPSETIYFEASSDNAGNRLRGGCVYQINGAVLPAKWWSVTAYADDLFLIPNPINRFSFNMGNVGTVDGRFTVTAAGVAQPGNWLPTGADGFHLIVRLYNPFPASVGNPGGIALPSIRAQGPCP